MKPAMRILVTAFASALWLFARPALAGPETALREYAGGQVKKGVRSIGMGGDGATTGNYALVYKDAGSAIFDQGVTSFLDTSSLLSFSAVGFTTPTFWDDAAFYIIALGQHATDVETWTKTPASASKPPSVGDLSDTSVFLKFAKPLRDDLSFGVMFAYELSDATLIPNDGAAPIRFRTSYVPSGGAGLHFHPDQHFQVGVRVILNHDYETRTQGASSKRGFLRSYEYRLGAAYSPWKGTLFDLGGAVLDRSNGLEHTTTFKLGPTVGVEQALVQERFWLRAGLDETTWTSGLSVAFGVVKVDLAGLYNLAQARTADVFGKRNISVIATVNFDYARALAGEAKAAAGPAAARGNGEATRKPERASDYMRDPPPTMNPQ